MRCTREKYEEVEVVQGCTLQITNRNVTADASYSNMGESMTG